MFENVASRPPLQNPLAPKQSSASKLPLQKKGTGLKAKTAKKNQLQDTRAIPKPEMHAFTMNV